MNAWTSVQASSPRQLMPWLSLDQPRALSSSSAPVASNSHVTDHMTWPAGTQQWPGKIEYPEFLLIFAELECQGKRKAMCHKEREKKDRQWKRAGENNSREISAKQTLLSNLMFIIIFPFNIRSLHLKSALPFGLKTKYFLSDRTDNRGGDKRQGRQWWH